MRQAEPSTAGVQACKQLLILIAHSTPGNGANMLPGWSASSSYMLQPEQQYIMSKHGKHSGCVNMVQHVQLAVCTQMLYNCARPSS